MSNDLPEVQSLNASPEKGRDVIEVIVVAPSLAVRLGLRTLLSTAGWIEMVGEASRLSDLEAFSSQADVLILKASPGVTEELKVALQSLPPLAVMLLVEGENSEAHGLPELPLRAWGVLSLEASAEELTAAVAALHEGLIVGTASLLKPMLMETGAYARSEDQLVEPLTSREIEVLQLLAQGQANKQIAHTLGISEHTVKFHVSAIYTKLNATNRTEAVRLGVRQGLVVL